MRSATSRPLHPLLVLLLGAACFVPIPLLAALRAQNPAAAATPGAATKQLVGRALPDVSVQDYDLKPVKFSTFKGKPAIITFWATWCGPCVREMPTFQKLLDDYKGRLQILAVATSDARPDSIAFIKKHPEYRFTFLHDPDWQGGNSRLAEAFGIVGLPTNLFIDAKGAVVDVWLGSGNEAALVKRVQGLMAK